MDAKNDPTRSRRAAGPTGTSSRAEGTADGPRRDRRPRWLLPVAVLALAAAVRLLFVLGTLPTGCLAINEEPISDMWTFHRWALTIVQGDWLGREDFHPYHPWQRGIAPEGTWLSWYGPRVFHQEPLYPYFIALVYLLAPDKPFSIVLVQISLGALTAAGIALLAARLFGPRAALAAGVIAAVYGPLVFHETLLLRDTLLVPLTTGLLLCLEEARRRGSAGWWAISGALSGAIYLTKANILVFVLLLILWLWAGAEVKRRSVATCALLAGFAACLAPAVARNVAVGAPPLKTTTRGAIEFINGNNPYHPGVGWFDGEDQRVVAYAKEILNETRGRVLPTISRVLGSWRGRYFDLARLQVTKLGYFLAPFEMPDNASYGYFRLNTPVLRFLPTFHLVGPLAALGLILTLSSWRRLLPHYLFLAAGIAVTVAFYVIARFRVPYLPLVFAFAGAGAAGLVEAAGERRWIRLAASAVLVAGLFALNSALTYPDLDFVRPQDYVIAAESFAARGEFRRAASELDRGRAIFPDFAPLHAEAARMHERAGDREAALAAYEEALARSPGDGRLREAIRRLRAHEAR